MSDVVPTPPDVPAPPAAPAPNSAEFVRLQLENSMLKKGAKPGPALDDCLDSMLAKASVNESGQVRISGMELSVAVDTTLAARTYLMTSAPPNTVLQQAVKSGWDPARCMEPAYAEQWKKADPKGHEQAVNAHLKAVMEKQRAAAQH